ncbi:hypothetical protein GCM10025864_44500 [Luteimicrobium album]|uniref:Tail terminator n=1 Tax=Luteimicrobium album TaxID=1054550 RepID=A0ABQ6HUT6_9MICO|nr:minor capsid protein [Luteimicrobium album]GMA22285.1 hypothetical protein GCM10025864_00440 [Luteimicrobium album]GMA26691.1 hypothetical protein GCM10025864_44500 [Luteimicrobium album]
MGWTTDLLEGVAQMLADAGVGVWRPDGPAYTASEVGIVVGRMPASPDQVLAITSYPVTSSALSDTVIGVQVRARGPRGADPRPVNDLTDAVYEHLHGVEQLTFGGVYVAHAWRASLALLGADDAGREETSSNFYVTTAHASVYVTD